MTRKVLTPAGPEYKAVSFDFVQARLRREDESSRSGGSKNTGEMRRGQF
jgi:hypothetical protein